MNRPRTTMRVRRPWNAVLAGVGLLGWRGADLDVEALLARARRMTGLDDFGDPEFLEPLRLVLGDFERHANADRTGRQVFAALLGSALQNRLRIGEALRAFPEIAEEPIVRPLFIVGLPRTGTTLLQGLLASVPGLRTLVHFETRVPEMPPALAVEKTIKRIRARAEGELGYAHWVSPRLAGSHEVGVDLPEECNPLLLTSMRALLLGAMFECPAYADFLYSTGFRHAYDWHRPHMQILAYRQPACTWALKAPAHLAGLPELLRIYPDARIVFTHRDPVETAASTAGLFASLHQLFTPVVDPLALGARVLPLLRAMADSASAARRHWPALASPYIDVRYEDLVRDPVASVHAILRHFDIAAPPDTDERLRLYLGRERPASLRYTCAEFGLSETEARIALAGWP